MKKGKKKKEEEMKTILAFLLALAPLGLSMYYMGREKLYGPAGIVIMSAGLLVTMSLILLFFGGKRRRLL